MKRHSLLLALSLFFVASNCFGVPDQTMSITPTPVNATVISASDETTRNNKISTPYNAHTHTDITTLGTIATGVWQGTDIAAEFIDNFNPQVLSRTASQTEGSGTETDIDFGATDTITATIDGNQSVWIILTTVWNNNDAGGGIDVKITDDSNNQILAASESDLGAATIENNTRLVMIAHDTRPSSGTKIYKARFNRQSAGTAELTNRTFHVITYPDPS